jgi:hypothetical protein
MSPMSPSLRSRSRLKRRRSFGSAPKNSSTSSALTPPTGIPSPSASPSSSTRLSLPTGLRPRAAPWPSS